MPVLPDFPYLKRQFHEEFTYLVRTLINRDPLLSQIKTETQFEGDMMKTEYESGLSLQSQYTTAEGSVILDNEIIISEGPLGIIKAAPSIAQQMSATMKDVILKQLQDICDSTGNVIQGSGEITQENYLALLEKMDIDFNEDGTPRLPTLVCHPSNSIVEAYQEWLKDEEFIKNLKDLVERKREEWNAKQSDRKLVD